MYDFIGTAICNRNGVELFRTSGVVSYGTHQDGGRYETQILLPSQHITRTAAVFMTKEGNFRISVSTGEVFTFEREAGPYCYMQETGPRESFAQLDHECSGVIRKMALQYHQLQAELKSL